MMKTYAACVRVGRVPPLVMLPGTRAAFAMGLLATKKDDSELAEALHLEAVLVLDRLPEVRRLLDCYTYRCAVTGMLLFSSTFRDLALQGQWRPHAFF